jgi:hypothetical protein
MVDHCGGEMFERFDHKDHRKQEPSQKKNTFHDRPPLKYE